MSQTTAVVPKTLWCFVPTLPAVEHAQHAPRAIRVPVSGTAPTSTNVCPTMVDARDRHWCLVPTPQEAEHAAPVRRVTPERVLRTAPTSTSVLSTMAAAARSIVPTRKDRVLAPIVPWDTLEIIPLAAPTSTSALSTMADAMFTRHASIRLDPLHAAIVVWDISAPVRRYATLVELDTTAHPEEHARYVPEDHLEINTTSRHAYNAPATRLPQIQDLRPARHARQGLWQTRRTRVAQTTTSVCQTMVVVRDAHWCCAPIRPAAGLVGLVPLDGLELGLETAPMSMSVCPTMAVATLSRRVPTYSGIEPAASALLDILETGTPDVATSTSVPAQAQEQRALKTTVCVATSLERIFALINSTTGMTMHLEDAGVSCPLSMEQMGWSPIRDLHGRRAFVRPRRSRRSRVRQDYPCSFARTLRAMWPITPDKSLRLWIRASASSAQTTRPFVKRSNTL